MAGGQPHAAQKETADYVFHELTRSIYPDCRRTVDARVILRDGKVFMRKRCPDHGPFESLVYGDAEAYVRSSRFNKPGEIRKTRSVSYDSASTEVSWLS
jgi:hypothetical protein